VSVSAGESYARAPFAAATASGTDQLLARETPSRIARPSPKTGARSRRGLISAPDSHHPPGEGQKALPNEQPETSVRRGFEQADSEDAYHRSVAMEPSPILVAIREDLARLEAAAAASTRLAEEAMAELYPLLTAAQDALGELAEALERRAGATG
jgi:hypothetical protein